LSTPYWGPDFDALAAFDPDIAGVVTDELDRLRGGLQSIASENFTRAAVLAALGSTLSNKCAGGCPGRRCYGGCEVVDRAEVASGIRVGSPAVTTQGMTESDMRSIAPLIGAAIRDADGSRTTDVAAGVRERVGAHPAYPEPIRAG
jgi:glycine/serine hydroxymethyltransferase